MPMPPNASKPNRLSRTGNPYLLQHAHNPVDWYPWGDEALARARAENRPVLLSIGYSTCHWCHVMERESFSDPRVAEVMNRHFVCIKVDREDTRALLAAARDPRLPEVCVAFVNDDDAVRALARLLPQVERAALVQDRPAAYVCVDRSCREPLTAPDTLAATLAALGTPMT
jgi:uncharacterized protein YyaL (SSP411 family)